LRQLESEGLLVSEEHYLRRQSFSARFSQPSAWMLVALKGRVLLELQGRETQVGLLSSGPNVCLTHALDQELLVLDAPLQLVRLRLPSALGWQPREFCGRVDLSLLLPTLHLLFQARQDGASELTVQRLKDALQGYCMSQLASCGVELVAAAIDPLASLLLWIKEHLHEPLTLADLASATRLSARRLQELSQKRYGLSPMELLRQQRLEVFHADLLDPAQAKTSVAALLRSSQLVNSAATRQAFEARYGETPNALRKAIVNKTSLDKRSVTKSKGGKTRGLWPLHLIGAPASSS
jgi:AraC-like DNA-binding protein